jgi:hypothetical protein
MGTSVVANKLKEDVPLTTFAYFKGNSPSLGYFDTRRAHHLAHVASTSNEDWFASTVCETSLSSSQSEYGNTKMPS